MQADALRDEHGHSSNMIEQNPEFARQSELDGFMCGKQMHSDGVQLKLTTSV
jgi:hypothetical protein